MVRSTWETIGLKGNWWILLVMMWAMMKTLCTKTQSHKQGQWNNNWYPKSMTSTFITKPADIHRYEFNTIDVHIEIYSIIPQTSHGSHTIGDIDIQQNVLQRIRWHAHIYTWLHWCRYSPENILLHNYLILTAIVWVQDWRLVTNGLLETVTLT